MRSQSAVSQAEYVGGSKVRLRLLLSLITGPKSQSQLASMENKHVSHVSRALSEMKVRGIVESLPGGSRETFYRLTSEGYIVYSVLSKIN